MPFRYTGGSTWGIYLPVDLPIWGLTVKIWNCHSDPLADLPGGCRSANFEHTLHFMLCFTEGPFVYTKDQYRKGRYNSVTNGTVANIK